MIYDAFEFQEGNVQGSHKIFVNKVEKYRLVLNDRVDSITYGDREYRREDLGKGIHNYFSFERWLRNSPVKMPRK